MSSLLFPFFLLDIKIIYDRHRECDLFIISENKGRIQVFTQGWPHCLPGNSQPFSSSSSSTIFTQRSSSLSTPGDHPFPLRPFLPPHREDVSHFFPYSIAIAHHLSLTIIPLRMCFQSLRRDKNCASFSRVIPLKTGYFSLNRLFLHWYRLSFFLLFRSLSVFMF